MLEGKKGEATAFPKLLERVVEKYGKHFKYVTGDAGLTSAANARAVRAMGKHYLFALKENFSRLHDVSWMALATAPVQERKTARGVLALLAQRHRPGVPGHLDLMLLALGLFSRAAWN
jgi:hypothetical protein